MNINDFISKYKLFNNEQTPTYIQISGYPRWENVWSNILSFYLNNGFHNMDGFLMKCLSLAINTSLGDISYAERECYTTEGKRIDILIITSTHCVFIENKVDAPLNNDLNEYLSYCEKISENKKVIGIVLGRSKFKVPNNVVSITYKELVENIENNISEIIYKANAKYFSMFIDFIENAKLVMEGNMDFDTSFFEMYQENKDKVLNIVHNYNKLNQYCIHLASSYANSFREMSFINIEKVWVFEKYTTVIDMKELNNDIKIAFDLTFSVDRIYITLFNRKNKPNDENLLSDISPIVNSKMKFKGKRFLANTEYLLPDEEKIKKDYIVLVSEIIDDYNKKFA